jgi:phage gp45-like
MSDPFQIVKDSSVWINPDNYADANKLDGLIRVGTIKKAVNDGKTGEIRYLVEINTHGDKVELNCRMMRRFGGVYNYEDYIFQGYKIDDKPDPVNFSEAKAGDLVLVCFLNGQGREGAILGGVSHAARKTEIKATDGPQYKTEFNGIETFINKDGEMTVTFKGIPTNIALLAATPSARIPSPKYDTAVGTSFYKFDKTGSWTVSDNAKSDKQFIKIDKKEGVIEVVSGKISLKMTKKTEEVSLKCKLLDVIADDKITAKTKELAIDASDKASIKSPKVAIGKEGVELLDQLAKLVDALAKVIPISPVGPCSSLMASPQWSGVEQVKAKIKEITGTF